MNRFVLAALAILSIVPAARASVIWKGDFENGSVSQWSQGEEVSPDRLKVTQNPVREGKYALDATVHQGDDPINASGNRNELVYTGDQVENQERYYAWSTMWPDDYPSEPTWQLFTQWHHYKGGGSPPVEFYVNGEKIYLRCSGTVLWSAPLERGRWHDFVFHLKWAPDGWVELYYDGQLVVPKTPAHTLFKGDGAYLKQGLYRNENIAKTAHVYHDGMTVATTAADVAEFMDAGMSASGGAGLHQNADGSVDVKAGGCDQSGAAALPALGMALVMFLLPRRQRMLARAGARR